MTFMDQVYVKAKAANATIILADKDERAEQAAKIIEEQGLAKIIILEDGPQKAAEMVAAGEADGYVAGNISATADVLRPAIKVIGTTGFASSCMIMVKDDTQLFFSDCAFNINPNAEQLAQIAIDTAATAQSYGVEPRVAFLSFSTKGSAKSPEVEKVQEAVKIAKEKGLDCDGELQFDTAFVPDVAKKKAPDSPLKGNANVFIFPDLNSGNIGYKIAQRLGGFQAIGGVLQGFKKPVNDLSRGCSVQDIVDIVAITAMQARNL